MTKVIIDRLTAHILHWLQEVVPESVSVSSNSPGQIETRSRSGDAILVEDISAVLDQGSVTRAEGVVTALHAVLSAVQDFVIEDSYRPWPCTSAGDFALPEVDIVDQDIVVAGFKFDDEWVLQMPEFALPVTDA
jgi:hypothetical protein